MIFSWIKNRRRRKILDRPFPKEWIPFLEANVAHYSMLRPEQQQQLAQCVQVFVAEKSWEGCESLEINDEIKVTVASQACLLLLGIEHDYFRNVRSILIFPDSIERDIQGSSGVMETTSVLGEAHYRGPVVLSWTDVRHGGIDGRDGRNLVYHEFAHKLDMLDDVVDGTPTMGSPDQLRQWVEVMTDHFNTLRRRAAKGQATLLDHYGATDPGEFFAVATECFFEKPRQMGRKHPDLYDLLCDFYRQDPAERVASKEP